MPVNLHDAVMGNGSGPVLRAFIYDRVSRLMPRGSNSVRDQSLENRRFCEARGWAVVAEFEDPGRSASRYARTTRPGYEQMLERARKGECDVIVVWESSRANRDTEAHLKLARDVCERMGILLCINGQVHDMRRSDDRFRAHIDALMAEREADAIRDRVLRTTRLNAERGGPHGRLPYGYRREYDPQTRALLRQVVDEEKAEIVREIAARVAGGQSLSAIRRDLAARGVPSPHGEEWTLTTLRNLVLRPTNIGKRQHQGQIVGDARWEPILDEETFYACLKVLSDPARKVTRDRDLRHMLAGVPVCGRCLFLLAEADQPMRSLHAKEGHFIYVCRSCYRVSVRTEPLERYVCAIVLARIEQPDFAAALKPDVSRDAVREALAEAEVLEGQLAQARELASTVRGGRIALPMGEFTALAARLTPLIEAARARALDATVPPIVRAVGGPGARDRFEVMGLAQRRALVRAVARVVVYPAGRGVRGVGPHRVSVHWLL